MVSYARMVRRARLAGVVFTTHQSGAHGTYSDWCAEVSVNTNAVCTTKFKAKVVAHELVHHLQFIFGKHQYTEPLHGSFIRKLLSLCTEEDKAYARLGVEGDYYWHCQKAYEYQAYLVTALAERDLVAAMDFVSAYL